jgi:pSer/pThr/pTyr-binding forkhead associated (FHA) protein
VAKLVVRQGRNFDAEHPIPPDKDSVILGRGPESDIRVLDPQASRMHARVTRKGERFSIRDLGSSNGTRLNGKSVEGEMVLRLGDRIRIGETVYQLVPEREGLAGTKAEDGEPRDRVAGVPPAGEKEPAAPAKDRSEEAKGPSATPARPQVVEKEMSAAFAKKKTQMLGPEAKEKLLPVGREKEGDKEKAGPADREAEEKVAPAQVALKKALRRSPIPRRRPASRSRGLVLAAAILGGVAFFGAAIAVGLSRARRVPPPLTETQVADGRGGTATSGEVGGAAGREDVSRLAQLHEAGDAASDEEGSLTPGVADGSKPPGARAPTPEDAGFADDVAEDTGDPTLETDDAEGEDGEAVGIEAPGAPTSEDAGFPDEPADELALGAAGDEQDPDISGKAMPRGGTGSGRRARVGAELKAVTGGHTRLVWVQDAGDNNDTFATGDGLKLMGFDSKDGRGERELVSRVSNYAQPMFTPGGDRVVYSNTVTNTVYVVDWKKGVQRLLVRGVAADVWMDPRTKVEWVYFQVGQGKIGQDFNRNPIWRCRLDRPDTRQIVWEESPVDIVRHSNFQVSADGELAGGAFPWNQCGVAEIAEGELSVRGQGSWASLAPDNSGVFWHLDESWRNLLVYAPGDLRPRNVAVDRVSGFKPRQKVCHARWSNNVRFMTMTGPYHDPGSPSAREGAGVEVYLGRFNPGLTRIETWVRVTRNGRADFYPDAWIDPAAKLIERASGRRPGPATERARALRREAPAGEATPWPSNPTGMALRWRNGKQVERQADADKRAIGHCVLEPRGRARYGRFFDMQLAAGTFVAVEGTDRLLAACRETDRLSVEALVTARDLLGGGAIVSFSSEDGSRNFTISQDGETLALRLRTSATGEEGCNPPVPLCKFPDTSPHHVVMSYRSGSLACYLDGRPASMTNQLKGSLAGWTPQKLVFGDEAAGGADWAGRLEGLAVYNRSLGPDEALANSLLFRDELDGRAAAERLVVRAELTALSTASAAGSIGQRRRSLVVHVWDMKQVVEGTCEEKRIAVAHWAILDGKVLPGARREGAVARLVLEPFSDHPQLELEHKVDEVGGDELDLYYEVGE